MPSLRIQHVSFLLAASLLPTAFAQHRVFDIDPEASSIGYSLSDILHSVHGSFHVDRGSIDFDPAAQKIAGAIAVAAGSGKSGNDTRDRKMTSEILDAAHFPIVSFAPNSYKGTINSTGDSAIQVTGSFTILSAAHELTVPMQVHMEGVNCVVKAHFIVPYVKWGLKDPSTFVLRVGKEVQIDVILVGRLASANQGN